ncbi:hypothetical protein ACAW74_16380 [Fibrella sp. WM1]|uniref:hypothetical protein n=1 Tax=Fibrella musci TaxID=3242485 RepID=UPI0035204A58
MDSLTLIVSALSAGAVAAAKSTVQSAVKDSYEGIKALVKKKFGTQISIEDLEKNPNSVNKRESIKEDLEALHAHTDEELIQLSKNLIMHIKQYAPDTRVVGVDIEEVEAEFLKIDSVKSINTGVNVKKSKFKGGIDIHNISGGIDTDPK